jgi:hypothetical protein
VQVSKGVDFLSRQDRRRNLRDDAYPHFRKTGDSKESLFMVESNSKGIELSNSMMK